MGRIRLIFVLSLVILAVVFVTTILCLPSEEDYIESKKFQIISGENEWILEYNIINIEAREIKYAIVVDIDGTVYKDSIVVKPQKVYTYIHHIYRHHLERGEVTFTLYEDGKAEPVEQVTYHIDFD